MPTMHDAALKHVGSLHMCMVVSALASTAAKNDNIEGVGIQTKDTGGPTGREGYLLGLLARIWPNRPFNVHV